MDSRANGDIDHPRGTHEYVVAYPKTRRGRAEPFRYLWQFMFSQGRCKENFDISESARTDPADKTWQGQLSLFLLKILWFVHGPYQILGHWLEDALNFFAANGGFLKTLWRALFDTSEYTNRQWRRTLHLVLGVNSRLSSSVDPSTLVKACGLKFRERNSEDYVSAIGALDPRLTLYADKLCSSFGIQRNGRVNELIFSDTNYGSRAIADLLVMASKLAYENAAYVKKVVTKTWKVNNMQGSPLSNRLGKTDIVLLISGGHGLQMNFVAFYNCWNEFQQQSNTQVYLFTDQPKDANAIVVAFRGTEPFNALDWSTDFDFSWFEIKGLGRVHVGFLEALGLVDRGRMETFAAMNNNALSQQRTGHEGSAMSGLTEDVVKDEKKILAYDDITKQVKELMIQHPDAKLFVTGHSLGAALANLYTTLLFFNKEERVTNRLGALYTFGQPRVGGKKYCDYMSSRIVSKYWRVVYGNDLVPRVPSDDPIFRFKHRGYCYFFHEHYAETTRAEAPYRNYFSLSIKTIITQRLLAVYELFVSLFSGWIYGPEYRETYFATGVRLVGLIFPGIAAHIMNNYVNAIRLGPTPLQSTQKLQDLEQSLTEDGALSHLIQSLFLKLVDRVVVRERNAL